MDVIADKNKKLRPLTSFLIITISIVLLIYANNDNMIILLVIIILVIKMLNIYLTYITHKKKK